ncbi:MAG: helix-turn-helix domain-containing protein [Gammaproteobacteria bacterium]|nr:helix-turn-helix domain-containing protein [Gammaproteobacteria bacterium]
MEGYLTTKEAAVLLGITRQGVLKAIYRGRLRAVKIGETRRGYWLVPRHALERYALSRRVPRSTVGESPAP